VTESDTRGQRQHRKTWRMAISTHERSRSFSVRAPSSRDRAETNVARFHSVPNTRDEAPLTRSTFWNNVAPGWRTRVGEVVIADRGTGFT